MNSLSESSITALLRGLSKPIRLASISRNGFPLISTLWVLYEDGLFWCITQHRTLTRKNLAANPRCAFEIALDGERYKLLRGQGLATLDLQDGARVAALMIERYVDDPNGPIAAKLRAQASTEYAIRIQPRWVRGRIRW